MVPELKCRIKFDQSRNARHRSGSSNDTFLSVSDHTFRLATMCMIPADPDISGIGVRAAIYLQNLLSFIPAV
jgi:5'-deoxynucleotidase YfbR-like HD superfamily hydrolase